MNWDGSHEIHSFKMDKQTYTLPLPPVWVSSAPDFSHLIEHGAGGSCETVRFPALQPLAGSAEGFVGPSQIQRKQRNGSCR